MEPLIRSSSQHVSSSSLSTPSPTLTTLTILNIVITLTSTVFFYKELHALSSAPRFSNTMNTMFSVAIPLPFLLLHNTHNISTPKIHILFLLAVFNSAQNVLQHAGIDGINSGAYCVLLNQSVVPLTMIFSYILFHTKYTTYHILGAITVVLGVIVSNASSSHPRSLKYTLVFLAGCLPQTALNLLVERTKKTTSLILDVIFLLVIMNLMSLPLNLIFDFIVDGFVASPTLNDHRDGFRCLFHGTTTDDDDDDECNRAYVYAMVYAPLGVMFCISNFVLVRSVSSTYYFVVVAFILPVQNLLLSWDWLMGSSVVGEISNISNLCGMLIVTLGLFLYVRGMIVQSGGVDDDKLHIRNNDDSGDEAT